MAAGTVKDPILRDVTNYREIYQDHAQPYFSELEQRARRDRWVRKSWVYVITTFTGIGGILFGFEIGLISSLLSS